MRKDPQVRKGTKATRGRLALLERLVRKDPKGSKGTQERLAPLGLPVRKDLKGPKATQE